MRASIIVPDQTVVIDGYGIKGLDLSSLDAETRAVQWNETSGHIELYDGTNETLESSGMYQSIWDEHAAAKYQIENPTYTVTEIRQALITQLTAARKEQEQQGVVINGIRYAGDPGNRQALQEAIAFMDDAGLTEFESWKDSDNVFHASHPLADVRDAYRAIGARRAQLIATEGEYAAQITGGTFTDLSLVTWP